jgi:hypothetical protein
VLVGELPDEPRGEPTLADALLAHVLLYQLAELGPSHVAPYQ